MNKTLVIFDIDGTLLDSNKLGSKAFAHTFKRMYEVSIPSIDWKTYPHVVDDVIFGEAFKYCFSRYPNPDEVGQFKDEMEVDLRQSIHSHPRGYAPVKGATGLINHLAETGKYELGIATGGWQRSAEIKMNHIGISYGDFACAYADHKKNREAIIEDVLSQRDSSEFEKVVYVGDAVWDVRTTRNLNMPFIGIRIRGDQKILHDLGARHVIKDYKDVDHFEELIAKSVPPK